MWEVVLTKILQMEVANLGLNQLQVSPVKCEHECDMLTSIAIIFMKGVIYMIV